MTRQHRTHDDRLLDALEAIEGVPYAGPMWRVVREGRSVTDGSRGAGRWNPSDLSVLYGTDSADGAIAEINFHLTQGQPIFPSRMAHTLYELSVTTHRTLIFGDLTVLATLGVEVERYRELLYARTQEIASAAAFLGFDGLIAPSARWDCRTIVLFLSAIDTDDLVEIERTSVDWSTWRQANLLAGWGKPTG